MCYIGGAIHSTLANSGFTLRNSLFKANTASYGGSLYFGNDHIGINISSNVVLASIAEYGAGIYFDEFSSQVSLVGNTLANNVATKEGGAIYALASDLSMLDCYVLNNTAISGSGVYYPSDILIGHVNITSSLFEGNSASGLFGGVYVELASSVTIAASNFTGNNASFGSALGVKGSFDVDIHACSFLDNIAIDSAGAMSIEDSNVIAIGQCSFEGNVAQAGSGSALWLSSSYDVSIQDNTFIGNLAVNGGGAVYWIISSGMNVPIGLENALSNYYENNVAMYGSNISTDVAALTLSAENTYEVTNYYSNVPPVVVYAVDYYHQIVRVDSSGVAVMSVLSTAKCYQSNDGYVTGGFIEYCDAGVFNFSALGAYCDPGFSISVNITSPYYDAISTYFTLTFRSCVRGEYYQDSICKSCEAGTYSLTDPSTKELSDLSNSAICKPCPSGATGCYGDSIALKKGNWRISDSSSALLTCPYGDDACLGGTGSGDSLCRKGYSGKYVYDILYFNKLAPVIVLVILLFRSFVCCVRRWLLLPSSHATMRGM
jgi:predicted outer membrane repeat protein